METQERLVINELLEIARDLLIRARIANQKAVIVMETWDNNRTAAAIRREALLYRQDARFDRKEAREALRLVEKKTGQKYVRGWTYTALKDTLDGRNFREWVEYRTLYAADEMFQGIDPC